MKGSYRLCPVEGCSRRCSTAYLMCRPHWARVPRALQLHVYTTFGEMRDAQQACFEAERDPDLLGEAYGKAEDAYKAACKEAIDAAGRKERTS